MKAITIAIVGLLASTITAGAQSLSCVSGHSSLNCTLGDGFGPIRIIHVPQVQTAESIRATERWEDFCRPRIVQRAPDYVRRYVYAHPGCENGRAE